jgi:UPF0716 protein FxsA
VSVPPLPPGPPGPAQPQFGRPRPTRRAPVLLLGIGLVEVVLLIRLAAAIGGWPTFAMVLASAVLGVVVLGLVPRRVGERGILVLAGVLLIVPGLLSSAAGLALLVPAVRRRTAGELRRWAERRGLVMTSPEVTVIKVDPIRTEPIRTEPPDPDRG